MNLMEFRLELEKLDMPIQYQSFSVGQAPDLPYLIFYEDDSDNLFADNVNYFNNLNLTCELYSDEKDLELETKIQKLFYDNEIEYNSTETFIDSENMFLKAYSVSIIFDALADVKVKEVDKSKLQSLIDYIDSLKTDEYEQDGFNKLQTSLAYAKASLIDNETTQDEIDDNLDDLIDCLNKIILIIIEVDKSQLQEQVNHVDSLSAGIYTQETWNVLKNNMMIAKNILDNINAKQQEVDLSLIALLKAVSNLKDSENGIRKDINLYAPLFWESQGLIGGINSGTGELDNYNYYIHSNFIQIPITTTYVVAQNRGSDSFYIMFYDDDKKYINYTFIYDAKIARIIDMNRKAKYMRIYSNRQTSSSLVINKIKIEYDKETAYTIAPEDERFNILTQL